MIILNLFLDYQQWVICSGSEITSDGSIEWLQMTFCAVVMVAGRDTMGTFNKIILLAS
jgi:hypothetical protein